MSIKKLPYHELAMLFDQESQALIDGEQHIDRDTLRAYAQELDIREEVRAAVFGHWPELRDEWSHEWITDKDGFMQWPYQGYWTMQYQGISELASWEATKDPEPELGKDWEYDSDGRQVMYDDVPF